MKKTYEEVERRRRKSWFLWIGEYPSIFDFYYTLLHVSGAFMEIYRAFALRNNLQHWNSVPNSVAGWNELYLHVPGNTCHEPMTVILARNNHHLFS